MLTPHPVSGVNFRRFQMLKSYQPVDDLRDAIGVALAAGVSENEILSMVAIATADYYEPELPGFENPGLPIYDELPDGLIDLPTAAERYGCKPHRIYMWVYRGRLQERGRLRGPGKNGGAIVVCENDLLERINAPPNKGGRPKKM